MTYRVWLLIWCVSAVAPLRADTIKGREGGEVNGFVSYANGTFIVEARINGANQTARASRKEVSEIVFNDRDGNAAHLPPWIQNVPNKSNHGFGRTQIDDYGFGRT